MCIINSVMQGKQCVYIESSPGFITSPWPVKNGPDSINWMWTYVFQLRKTIAT